MSCLHYLCLFAYSGVQQIFDFCILYLNANSTNCDLVKGVIFSCMCHGFVIIDWSCLEFNAG
jgi:hypothetical protein